VLYPKVSVSLVPSDLAGWKARRLSATLSSLRLRAAVGQSGRQPGAFDKFTTYTALPSSTGGGLIPLNLGNPDLRPEVSTEWEGGGEAGLFRDRLSLTVTRWTRAVNDALVQKLFAGSGGFTAPQLTNVGRLRARGWELGANGFVVNRPRVALDLYANGAHLSQKVASLGGSPPIKVTPGYVRVRQFIKEGYAPGSLFGAKILQPCASYRNAAADAKGGCLQPGQTPYDLNNDRRPDTQAELLAALASPRNPTALTLLRADDDGNGDFLDHYQGKIFPDWSGAFGGNLRLGTAWRVSSLFEYKGGNYTITNLTDAFRNASPALGRNNLESATVEATLLNPASTAEQRMAAAPAVARPRRALALRRLQPERPGRLPAVARAEPRLHRGRAWRTRRRARPAAPPRRAQPDALDALPGHRSRGERARRVQQPGQHQLENNFYDASDTFGLPLPRRLSLSVRLGY
jgi:hypothetical protein